MQTYTYYPPQPPKKSWNNKWTIGAALVGMCIVCTLCYGLGMEIGIFPDTAATQTAEAKREDEDKFATRTQVAIQATLITWTPTPSYTPTNTPSHTPTPTATFTPSNTPTASHTPTITPTFTATHTPTTTFTPSTTPTASNTPLPSLSFEEFGGFELDEPRESTTSTSYSYWNDAVGGIGLTSNIERKDYNPNDYLEVTTETMAGLEVIYGFNEESTNNQGDVLTAAYTHLYFDFLYDGVNYSGEIVLAGIEGNRDLLIDTLRDFIASISPQTSFAPDSSSNAFTSPLIRYVNTQQINVRSGPGTDSRVLGQLNYREEIEVLGTNQAGDWYQIRFDDGEGWVAVYLTSETLPLPATTVSIPTPVILGVSCGGASRCTEMTSCEQAYACLQAGYTGLDRDRDGVPCEDICPGG
jgi:hypothetical protein